MNDKDVRSMVDTMVSTIQEQIKQNNDAQNQVIRYGLKGVRQYVDGNLEAMNVKLDSVIEINRKQNDSLAKHQQKIGELDERVLKNESHVRIVQKVSKHWGKILSALIILVLVVSWMANHVDFKKTFTKKTGIEFKVQPVDSIN